MNGQDQEAGDRSQQYQARRDANVTNVTNITSVTYSALTAGDVIDITRAAVERVRDELTLKVEAAESIADARMKTFEAKVIATFAENAPLRDAFADPDFQYSLRDAGRAAMSSGEEHTEDLLVELLKNRAERGNHARVRLATSHAIRAADKLSVETLNALAATWMVAVLGPTQPGLWQTVPVAENSLPRIRSTSLRGTRKRFPIRTA